APPPGAPRRKFELSEAMAVKAGINHTSVGTVCDSDGLGFVFTCFTKECQFNNCPISLRFNQDSY
ncbi:MAG: hypothetical protein ACJAWN_001047, partial [Neolewinella sp.]